MTVSIQRFQFSPPPANSRISPEEEQLREQFDNTFGGWVWDIANQVLEKRYTDADFGINGLRTTERLKLLRKALPGGNGRIRTLPKYPRRQEALPSSPEVDSFRQVLSSVPILRGNCDNRPPGITFHMDMFDGDVTYDWENEIYGNIYKALLAIIDKLGLDAWKAARWEVYDKYTESIGGIQFVKDRDEWWLDGAETWLEGKIKFNQPCIGPLGRLQTASGKEYNEALPKLRPGE